MKDALLHRGSTFVLRTTIWTIGLLVLVICLFVLPYAIRTDATGYYRPIVIGLYVPAIPFFIALYQALKLLGYIDRNKAFSELSVKAIRNIKYCGLAISGMFAAGMPYIY